MESSAIFSLYSADSPSLPERILERYFIDLSDFQLICSSLDATSVVFRRSRLNRDEMVAESFIQLFAGTDTTSNTLTWFFYLIAKHPRVESKLIDELKASGLTDVNGVITSEMMDKLPYYEATLKETMRLLPVVSIAPWRTVPEGGKLIKGYWIPGGVLNPFVI